MRSLLTETRLPARQPLVPVSGAASSFSVSAATGSRSIDLARYIHQCGLVPAPTDLANPKRLIKRPRSYQEQDFHGSVGVAICTGRLPDGRYLCRLDLDGHRADQDPQAAYEAISSVLGAVLTKCAVKRSTTGTGIDILFLAQEPVPNNQWAYIAGQHVGELFCGSGHVPMPAEWLSGSLETLQMLTDDELALLLTCVTITIGTRNPTTWTARWREVLPLIRGWRDVDVHRFLDVSGMPQTFSGAGRAGDIARANWTRLQKAKRGERSDAYANFIASLMLLANSQYGSTIEDKCRTVAAIAIELCPKKNEMGSYDVEKDTAAIIGKVLHGDEYRNRSGHFPIPYWAQEYRPARRARGRPVSDQAKQIDRLRNLLNKNAEGNRIEFIGRQRLTVEFLARKLGVTERSVQRYLHVLEQGKEIVRDSVGGRNGRLCITFLPAFGHPQGDNKCPGRVTTIV
jgi:hypothetical protein